MTTVRSGEAVNGSWQVRQLRSLFKMDWFGVMLNMHTVFVCITYAYMVLLGSFTIVILLETNTSDVAGWYLVFALTIITLGYLVCVAGFVSYSHVTSRHTMHESKLEAFTYIAFFMYMGLGVFLLELSCECVDGDIEPCTRLRTVGWCYWAANAAISFDWMLCVGPYPSATTIPYTMLPTYESPTSLPYTENNAHTYQS